MSAARLRQWWADLLSRFWLRPGLMCLFAVVLSETLVRFEGRVDLPSAVADWLHAGGAAGARDVLQTTAGASIAVAGTTFSITVAALTLATSQMGPRLLRNFTREAGHQYALGLLVATFAYALVALRSVHESDESSFVPQLALTGALILAFASGGALVWFLHHMATSINVDRVIALVRAELVAGLRDLPERRRAVATARDGLRRIGGCHVPHAAPVWRGGAFRHDPHAGGAGGRGPRGIRPRAAPCPAAPRRACARSSPRRHERPERPQGHRGAP